MIALDITVEDLRDLLNMAKLCPHYRNGEAWTAVLMNKMSREYARLRAEAASVEEKNVKPCINPKASAAGFRVAFCKCPLCAA
jgi:hypothetical protein